MFIQTEHGVLFLQRVNNLTVDVVTSLASRQVFRGITTVPLLFFYFPIFINPGGDAVDGFLSVLAEERALTPRPQRASFCWRVGRGSSSEIEGAKPLSQGANAVSEQGGDTAATRNL